MMMQRTGFLIHVFVCSSFVWGSWQACGRRGFWKVLCVISLWCLPILRYLFGASVTCGLDFLHRASTTSHLLLPGFHRLDFILSSERFPQPILPVIYYVLKIAASVILICRALSCSLPVPPKCQC